jgi:hypothetical protein
MADERYLAALAVKHKVDASAKSVSLPEILSPLTMLIAIW